MAAFEEAHGHELVGRALERGVAREALAGSTSVAGTLAVVVLGSPGIGKSHFLEAMKSEIERDSHILIARPASGDRECAYATLSDALHSLPSEMCDGMRYRSGLGRALTSKPPDHARIRNAIVEAVTCLREQRPTALIIDGLHRADRRSLATCTALLRQPGRHPLSLVVAAPALADCDPIAQEVFDWLAQYDALATVTLGPLDEGAVADLIEVHTGAPPADDVVDAVLRAACGHPFLTRELALEFRDTGDIDYRAHTLTPDRRSRVLRRLFGTETSLACSVAFLGSVPPDRIPLVATLVDRPESEAVAVLDRLVQRGVVDRDAEGVCTVPSPMVAGALDQSIDSGRRSLWRRRIVAWLSEHRTCARIQVELADHVRSVAEDGDASAVAVLTRAANLVASTDPQQAIEWYRASLHAMPPTDLGRALVQSRLSRICYLAGKPGDAVHMGRAALAGLASGPDRTRMLRLMTEASILGDDPLLDLVLAEDATGNPYLLAVSAHLYARLGRLGEAADALVRAQRALSTADVRDHAQCLTHIAHTYGLLADNRNMLDAIERVLGIAAGSKPSVQLNAFLNSSYLLALHGSPLASTTAPRAREVMSESGIRAGHTELALAEVIDAFRTGDWDDALAIAEGAAAYLVSNEALNGLAVLRAFEAEILTHQGKWDTARRVLRDQPTSAVREGLRNWATAGLDLAIGDGERARQHLQDSLAQVTVPKFRRFLLTRMAEVELAAGEHGKASATVAAFCPSTVDETSSLLEIDALRLHGRATADLDCLRATRDAADQREAALLRGQTRLDLAEVGQESEPELREAYDIFHRLGADPWRRKVTGELRRRGCKVPRYRGPKPTVLTDGELQVARLVQQGRRNREIARTLSMSVKTVEAYLARAYAKTQCTSRLELARALDNATGDHGA